VDVGGGPYPAPGPRSGVLALAGGSKPFSRSRVSAATFSLDTWALEIRPIIDKQLGPWYLSFNPTLDRSFHGPGVTQGVSVSPNFKVGYDVTRRINVGLEYYGALGSLTGF
jgi:hypothetical protein